MFGYHYTHKFIETPKGIFLIDVADTGYSGWEGAFAEVDLDSFAEQWGDNNYTFEDVVNYAEDFDCISDWEIVSNGHRNPEVAERNVYRAIKGLSF